MADCGAAPMALFPPQSGADQGGEGDGNGSASFTFTAGSAGAVVAEGAPAATRRRPRGRPRGSKNKPKATVVVTRESESAMRSVVLELAGGTDVLAGVNGFARRRGVGLSVMSGCGGVSDVTLRHPGCSSTLTFRGLFDILSLTGAFLPAGPRWTGSSSVPPVLGSYFSVSLAGSQGELIGGVVEGPLIAAGTVRVIVATFASLEIHKLPSPRGEEEEGGSIVLAGEEMKQQMLVGDPPNSSATMEMVYNVGPGGDTSCEVPEEAASWSSRPGRAGTSRYRNPPNQFHQYY